jgi:hypothetical protein
VRQATRRCDALECLQQSLDKDIDTIVCLVAPFPGMMEPTTLAVHSLSQGKERSDTYYPSNNLSENGRLPMSVLLNDEPVRYGASFLVKANRATPL